MTNIRPFEAADINGVAELHREVNLGDWPMTDRLHSAYHTYLKKIFLENPWRRGDLPSLVCVAPGSRIQGFLGVVPRTMRLGGETVTSVVSSQLVVAKEARTSFAGLRLMRDFLAGAQDLAMADEANDKVQAMWTRLGGRVMKLHSVSWLRPLRPVAYLLTADAVARRLRGLKPLAMPVAALIDGVASRILQARRSAAPDRPSAAAPAAGELLAFMREDGRSAEAFYTEETLGWTLARAREKTSFGSLRSRMVTAYDGRALGWYAFYDNPGGVAQVLHLSARPGATEDVFETLLEEARDGGAVALAGRCDGDLLPVLADAHCLLHPTGRWVLLHAARPELLEAFRDDDARLSRLDGEFVLRFDPEAATLTP